MPLTGTVCAACKPEYKTLISRSCIPSHTTSLRQTNLHIWGVNSLLSVGIIVDTCTHSQTNIVYSYRSLHLILLTKVQKKIILSQLLQLLLIIKMKDLHLLSWLEDTDVTTWPFVSSTIAITVVVYTLVFLTVYACRLVLLGEIQGLVTWTSLPGVLKAQRYSTFLSLFSLDYGTCQQMILSKTMQSIERQRLPLLQSICILLTTSMTPL